MPCDREVEHMHACKQNSPGSLRADLYPRLEGPGTSPGDSEIYSVAAAVEIGDCGRHERIVWPTQKGLHLVTAGGPAANSATVCLTIHSYCATAILEQRIIAAADLIQVRLALQPAVTMHH